MDSNMMRSHLRGPRPSALEVSRKSKSITKKPAGPVIVYLRSPKVIHVEPEEFMDTVQRLTGNQPSISGS